METRISIPFQATNLDEISAIHEEPPADIARRSSAVLLANGAGFHMESPWMASVAKGLVARGFAVLRFNYAYRQRALNEGKQKAPDRRERLEEAHRAALGQLLERADGRRILLAGKSLGGRISTYLAAKDEPCAGLVLFGYPLHPPGRPEKQRREHFPAIPQPALFLQGTRDNLCDLGLLDEALATYGGSATVEVIDDADHGFHVRKHSGRTDGEVLEAMLDRVVSWESDVLGG